ncbi:MAG: hypothetical protein KDB53_21190, partial [Planctomycetes bacterium]|nr:hypothetical protein [Planctomycetota bacterium]
VEVEDRIGPKDLHSESIFRGADRQELFRVSSELTAISAEEFTKRVRAVFSGLDVDAATGPAPRERYFAGKTRTLPDGKGLAVETETLLQLVFDRATGKITHFAVKVDPKGVAAPMALHLTFLVDGETFRIEAASKAAAGTGRLHGPAWGWSRIDREMTLPDGSRLVSSETLLEDGSLSADQTLHRPDGTKAFRFEDRLLPISGFEWSRRLQEANRR